MRKQLTNSGDSAMTVHAAQGNHAFETDQGIDSERRGASHVSSSDGANQSSACRMANSSAARQSGDVRWIDRVRHPEKIRLKMQPTNQAV
jgi:hypothetical protein